MNKNQNFHFLVVNFSVYLNRLVFVMSGLNLFGPMDFVLSVVNSSHQWSTIALGQDANGDNLGLSFQFSTK